MDIADLQDHIHSRTAWYEKHRQRYWLYHDDYSAAISEVLRKNFPNTYDQLRMEWVNHLREIIDLRSAGLYSSQPNRSFYVGDEPLEGALADRCRGVLRLNTRPRGVQEFDEVMDALSRLLDLHMTMLVRAVHRHGRVEWDLLCPSAFDVIEGGPDATSLDDSQALIVFTSANRRDYIAWVQPRAGEGHTEYWVVEDEELVSKTESPYEGRLPFVLARAEAPLSSLFCHGREDLVRFAINDGVHRTDLEFADRLQRFAVLNIAGGIGNDEEEQPYSPGEVLRTTSPASFIAPPDKVTASAATQAKKRMEVARRYDVPPHHFSEDQELSSANDRRVADRRLNDRRKAIAKRMERVEAEVWRATLEVHNAHSADKLPQDVEMDAAIEAGSSALDPLEGAQRDQHMLMQNRTDGPELIAKDRGISREEAVVLYEKFLRFNGALNLRGAAGATSVQRSTEVGVQQRDLSGRVGATFGPAAGDPPEPSHLSEGYDPLERQGG